MSMHGWPSTGVCTGKVTFLSPALNDTWSSLDTGGSSDRGLLIAYGSRAATRRAEGRDYRIAAFPRTPDFRAMPGVRRVETKRPPWGGRRLRGCACLRHAALPESHLQVYFCAYRLRNLSTRPPVSMILCLPV